VTHARHVPAQEREAFASGLRAGSASTALILETCHRVEAYTTDGGERDPAELAAALPEGGRLLSGDVAVRHAVTVATGRDSVVLGEDQILHQIRESLSAARRAGALDPDIDRLFGLALQAGRRARSWRSGRRRSLADVAVEVAEGQIGSLRNQDLLVVGAGRMGELVARAAASAGASLTIVNRSDGRARALATATGGRTMRFDPGREVDRYAAVFVALGGPWTIDPPTEAALLDRRPLVVDLSVPLAVPRVVVAGLGTRFVTADDLAHRDVAASEAAGHPDPRFDELIDDTVQAFADWQARSDARAAAEALVKRADEEREAELAALWRQLPALEPEARQAIEGMTRHLAARLLRQPLERLGRDRDGAEERIVRELFAL